MKTVGDKLEPFVITGVKPGQPADAFFDIYDTLKKEGYTVEQLRDIGRIASVVNSVAKIMVG